MTATTELKQIKQDGNIEISKNSRGITWSVKAYGSDNKEIRDNLNDLIQIAKAKVKELEAAEEAASV